MRCFQNSLDTLCSGVEDMISKLDFHTLGVRDVKIILVSPHELREENDFALLSVLESSRPKKKKKSIPLNLHNGSWLLF